jgi:hypothetical protein
MEQEKNNENMQSFSKKNKHVEYLQHLLLLLGRFSILISV